MSAQRHSAVVIEFGGRFYYGRNKAGHLMCAYTLAGRSANPTK